MKNTREFCVDDDVFVVKHQTKRNVFLPLANMVNQFYNNHDQSPLYSQT